MAGLRRTRVGRFQLADAANMEQLTPERLSELVHSEGSDSL
jgi:tRNA U55 pseudouridine synthase TruB